jgi:[DsrC]-trisulfide reductase subunit J
MYDGGKIITGLVIFLVLITFPIWYSLASGKGGIVPEPEKATGTTCVESTEYMVTSHMDLLIQWRDEVVRGGDRFHKMPDGTMVEKSLTNTCLDCHKDKKKFCDKCHDYAAVTVYCWDCHIIPEGSN